MNNNFLNKKIAILGLGIEGVSSALFLHKQGASVTVLDQNPSFAKASEGEGRKVIKELSNKGMKIITGKDYLKNLNQYDIIVRSPGIKRNLPKLVEAEKKGAIITSQIKLFFDLCPCPIIGVTGTKGKGTTSSLIYKMLKKQNIDVYLGGNIGQAPFDFLDKLKPHSWVVLELSSFQLQDSTKSPHIAVILMIVSEHLDYHKDIYEYVAAKRNILKFQTPTDFAIINKDYPVSNESDVHTEGKIFFVSRGRDVKEGCFVRDGWIVLRIDAEVANENFLGQQTDIASSLHQRLGRSAYSENFVNSPRQIVEKEIIDIEKILLPGKHNLENVCAAVMAAKLAGVSKINMINVIKNFKGLEHRLELIGITNGVKYYDDSFSTTPETAIAAIQAFKAPEILILGGSSKESDFTKLGQVINNSKNIKTIIGIGKEWSRIKLTINNSQLKIIEGCKDMRSIVQKASEIAQPGNIVILSPACASFDMFKNYKDRGEQFKKEVENLVGRVSHISREVRKT